MSAYDPKYFTVPKPAGSGSSGPVIYPEPVMTSSGELVTLDSGDLVMSVPSS